MDLAYNLQWLICHKTQPTHQTISKETWQAWKRANGQQQDMIMSYE